jgi:hypothetical protein
MKHKQWKKEYTLDFPIPFEGVSEVNFVLRYGDSDWSQNFKITVIFNTGLHIFPASEESASPSTQASPSLRTASLRSASSPDQSLKLRSDPQNLNFAPIAQAVLSGYGNNPQSLGQIFASFSAADWKRFLAASESSLKALIAQAIE